MLRIKLSFALFIVMLTPLAVLSQAPSIVIQPYASGFSSPVDVRHCGDERLFVVEQDGYIRIIMDSGNVLPVPFLDVDNIVLSGGEQGLLGLAFHPSYKQNGYFYVYYTNNSGNLAISRFSVSAADSNLANPLSELNLLTIPHPGATNHNGGCLRFGPDGYLYIGTGDGGGAGDVANNAQNPAKLLGKMIRIDVDNGTPYAIPPDNPYINDAGYLDEIWAMGMRNPWRFSFDRMNGDLYIGDVGQGLWEEVDYVKGAVTDRYNFGWRCYEGNHAYNTSGCLPQSSYDSAIFELAHSPSNYCSVVGGYVYRGGKYDDMFGYYFFGDYCNDTIHVLKPQAGGGFQHYTTIPYSAALGSFGEGYHGDIFVTNLNNGNVRKIVSTVCKPVAFVADQDTVRICADSIQLQSPDAPNQLYSWITPSGGNSGNTTWVSQTGWVKLTVINSSACMNSDSAYFIIAGSPAAASITGLDSIYCSNSSPADTLSGFPAGGVFSGSGITGNVFDPALSGDGSFLIQYQFTDTNNCISSTSQVVLVETCSGVAQVTPSELEVHKIKVINGLLDIAFTAKEGSKGIYILNDNMGRIISTGPLAVKQGRQTLQIDAPNGSGIYFWTLHTGVGSVTSKFVVTR